MCPEVSCVQPDGGGRVEQSTLPVEPVLPPIVPVGEPVPVVDAPEPPDEDPVDPDDAAPAAVAGDDAVADEEERDEAELAAVAPTEAPELELAIADTDDLDGPHASTIR